jgi:hypothetical protein
MGMDDTDMVCAYVDTIVAFKGDCRHMRSGGNLIPRCPPAERGSAGAKSIERPWSSMREERVVLLAH